MWNLPSSKMNRVNLTVSSAPNSKLNSELISSNPSGLFRALLWKKPKTHSETAIARGHGGNMYSKKSLKPKSFCDRHGRRSSSNSNQLIKKLVHQRGGRFKKNKKALLNNLVSLSFSMKFNKLSSSLQLHLCNHRNHQFHINQWNQAKKLKQFTMSFSEWLSWLKN